MNTLILNVDIRDFSSRDSIAVIATIDVDNSLVSNCPLYLF